MKRSFKVASQVREQQHVYQAKSMAPCITALVVDIEDEVIVDKRVYTLSYSFTYGFTEWVTKVLINHPSGKHR